MTALSIMLLTTGCVKLNLDLTVDGNDTVSGTMVFAVAKSLAELGGQSEAEATGPETENLFGDAENVKVEAFDDGDFVGSSYSFEGLPLEEFNPEVAEGSDFSLKRDGDNIIVSGVLDTVSDSEELENNPFGDALLAGLISSSEIRISITLPGQIKETNGTVEGQTVTWKGSFGEKLEINALAYSPKIHPFVWIIGSSLAFGLLVGLISLIFLRVRRGRSERSAGAQGSDHSIPTMKSVSSKVGLSDADIRVLESEYATNPERFAMDYLSESEFRKWRAAGEPSLKPWIGMGMVNFRKWLDLHK